jgi:formate--tetrahydrofolate ligase
VLKDALMPNLVQTLEGTPAFVHGGPFGNIAHGCNSAIATRMALKLADYVVTEAGFGSDLGAEKFFDIKCRVAELQPDAVVVVATVRALKMHGGAAMANLKENDPAALRKGIQNLEKHCENVRTVGLNPIVAINRFPTDTDEEIKVLQQECARIGVQFSLSEVWEKGGAGGLDLADMVIKSANKKSYFHCSYPLEITLKEKILRVAQQFYGAENIFYTPVAEKQLANFEELGFGQLPICIAKTQSSLSDDAKLLGRPRGFTVTVREAKLSAGAGFVVIYAGTVMTMPGLPKIPSAEKIGMTEDGEVYGLF